MTQAYRWRISCSPNLTIFADAGYTFPKNRLIDTVRFAVFVIHLILVLTACLDQC